MWSGYIFVYIIDNEMWKMFKLNIKKLNLVYDVFLNNESGYVKYKGFVDTGNNSKYLKTNKPIFYASKKHNLKLSNKKEVYILANTVNGKIHMKGYEFNNVIIKNNNDIKVIDAVICFTDDEIKNKLGCDMIINYEIYEELLGGIYI